MLIGGLGLVEVMVGCGCGCASWVVGMAYVPRVGLVGGRLEGGGREEGRAWACGVEVGVVIRGVQAERFAGCEAGLVDG